MGITDAMKLINRVMFLALFGLSGKGAFAAPAEENGALKAERLFKLRCASAGEEIKRTVSDVDRFLALKARPKEINLGDQFNLDDPYGSDLGVQETTQ